MNLSALFSNILLVGAGFLSIREMAIAQHSDTSHAGIHQIQSAFHQWDDLKIDSSYKEFVRGKEYAQKGKIQSAVHEFRKG
jgi:hypothetical protein